MQQKVNIYLGTVNFPAAVWEQTQWQETHPGRNLLFAHKNTSWWLLHAEYKAQAIEL